MVKSNTSFALNANPLLELPTVLGHNKTSPAPFHHGLHLDFSPHKSSMFSLPNCHEELFFQLIPFPCTASLPGTCQTLWFHPGWLLAWESHLNCSHRSSLLLRILCPYSKEYLRHRRVAQLQEEPQSPSLSTRAPTKHRALPA